MKTVSLFGLFIFFITSCNKPSKPLVERDTNCSKNFYQDIDPKGPICNTELCEKYFGIWKELFMEKNNISENFFNEHIKIWGRYGYDVPLNYNFSVCYTVDIDWVSARNCDNFIIKLNMADKSLQQRIPKDQFLSKEQIKSISEIKPDRAYQSKISKISIKEKVKFTSRSDALNQLSKKFKVSTLCTGSFYFNSENGHLMMTSNANFVGTNNCIFLTTDLETGETIHEEGNCLGDLW